MKAGPQLYTEVIAEEVSKVRWTSRTIKSELIFWVHDLVVLSSFTLLLSSSIFLLSEFREIVWLVYPDDVFFVAEHVSSCLLLHVCVRTNQIGLSPRARDRTRR